MKLRYETGVAAMAQFVVIVLLNFVGAIVSSVGSCQEATNTYSCVSDIGIDLLYVILLAAWFGFVWILAYAAQDKRNHRLATVLIGAEAMILVISLFNAKHYPNILGLITSLVDAAFAVWVIWLAFRLTRARGGRITSAAPRRRRPATK